MRSMPMGLVIGMTTSTLNLGPVASETKRIDVLKQARVYSIMKHLKWRSF